MIEKLMANFTAGVEKLRWFSSLMSERLKVELAVIKLMNEARALEEKKKEVLMAVGERVFELRGHEQAILKDPALKETLKELGTLNKDLEDLKKRISEMGGQ